MSHLIYLFQIYSSMIFSKCIQLCSYLEHTPCSKNFLHDHLRSICLPTFSELRQPLSFFLFLQFCIYQKFHVNRVVQYITLEYDSSPLTQSQVHPNCYGYQCLVPFYCQVAFHAMETLFIYSLFHGYWEFFTKCLALTNSAVYECLNPKHCIDMFSFLLGRYLIEFLGCRYFLRKRKKKKKTTM